MSCNLPHQSYSLKSVAKFPACFSKLEAPTEVSVAKPTTAQLSTVSLRNGAGTVLFPPAKNGATRGSSHPKVHAELAYLCAIGSSDIKDVHTYGNSLIRQLTHSCWGKKRRH